MLAPPELTEPAKGSRRWELVDMLRGIAVVLVLFRHHPASGFLQAYGWIGVDLFFVLSGFLVSGLIFDEYRRTGGFGGVRFLIRRGFKIYPSFYALIGISALLMWVTGRTDPWMNYVAEIFFFQNYHTGLWAHTWSLAVEEHFYFLLVLAAIVFTTWTKGLRWHSLATICMLLFAFFLGSRIYVTMQHPDDLSIQLGATHLRMDSLLAGVFLAAWHRARERSFSAFFGGPTLLLVGGIFILLLPVLYYDFGSTYMATVGLTGVYLAGGIAVGMAVTRTPRSTTVVYRMVVRPLARVGAISYTTYLWHLFVLFGLEMCAQRLGLQGSLTEFVAFVLLSILAGEITSRAIERPALALRERWFPARGR